MRKSALVLVACLTGATALIGSVPAFAAAALVTGNRNNDLYWTWNYDSIGGARQQALRNCRKQWGDCVVRHTWSNACLAVARPANRRGHGWAVRPRLKDAELVAIGECVQANGKACYVEDTACDGH